MGEQEFFKRSGVLITDSRAIFGGVTYALANVSSVKRIKTQTAHKNNGALGCAIISGVIAFFSLVAAVSDGGGGGVAIAVILGLAALIAWLIYANSADQFVYQIILTTNAGEVDVFTSSSANTAGEVLVALNKAIISRG